MNMKKAILALTFAVTGLAFADGSNYLYWMVDLDDADKNPYGIEEFTYATVSDDGGASCLEFYNTSGDPAGSEMGSFEPITKAGPLYSGLGSTLAGSYLFELWLENDKGNDSRVGWASYTAKQLSGYIFTALGQGGATPLTISVIPEPTSATLLLIGFAGLALRRRKSLKALLSVCVAGTLSLGVFAGADNLIYSFQPDANDTYADGTPIVEHERYALVWLSNGSDGITVNADGTVADPSKGEIVKVRRSLERGEEFVFQVDAIKKDALVAMGGKWAVYLLDTRVYGVDGSVSLAEVADGKVASVNAAKKLDKSVVEVDSLGNGVNSTIKVDAASTDVATALPADTPNPEITDISIVDGKIHVKVRKTVPYLQYNLASGETPDTVSGKAANAPRNGVAGEEIELVAPATSGSGFFRVNRN